MGLNVTCTQVLPATLLNRPWQLRLTDEETEANKRRKLAQGYAASKGQSQDANPGGPALRCAASRAHQVAAVWPGTAGTHLEILHGRGLLRPLAEHRPLQSVAPAGLQDVVEGTEIWKGEARSCAAVSGVGGFGWASGPLPSCTP